MDRDEQRYDRFYNNLALFAGGTIALSVTYLGYLKTLPKPIVHVQFLSTGWVALFVCLVTSLFYTLFHAHYGSYYYARAYSEAVKKRYETEARNIGDMQFENFRTRADLDAYSRPRLEAAQKSG